MLPYPRTDNTALQEIALLYFKQLEGKIRSNCRVVESSVTLTEIAEDNGELFYLYRAVFRCAPRRFASGELVSHNPGK